MTTKRLKKIPKGWVKTQGAIAPRGFEWYNNNESRFTGKRKIALIEKKDCE